MHHTFTHAHIPYPKLMVMAEMSTFGIFGGQNGRGQNVQAETSIAKCPRLKCPSTLIFTKHKKPIRKYRLNSKIKPQMLLLYVRRSTMYEKAAFYLPELG